jgi:hypothetical protein
MSDDQDDRMLKMLEGLAAALEGLTEMIERPKLTREQFGAGVAKVAEYRELHEKGELAQHIEQVPRQTIAALGSESLEAWRDAFREGWLDDETKNLMQWFVTYLLNTTKRRSGRPDIWSAPEYAIDSLSKGEDWDDDQYDALSEWDQMTFRGGEGVTEQ